MMTAAPRAVAARELRQSSDVLVAIFGLILKQGVNYEEHKISSHISRSLSKYFSFFLLLCLSLCLCSISFVFYYLPINNNKALSRFKCFNSRSPLPFPIDLSLITYVRALPD
ncbi:hypothetical protein Hdeb2414_s0082g00780931 [Helianthus debilis subsp. tardiflorus]